MKISQLNQGVPGITDEDVVHAMKSIPGYLDITPDDFMEVYKMAYNHAFERLKSAIRAEHVMTKKVITIDETMSLMDTARLMADHNLSGFPVMNAQNKVSGIISEKDFLKPMNVPKHASFMHIILQCLDNNTPCATHDLKNLSARDIMSSPPIWGVS
jgi:CBS-domain-containing membrane protein